MQRCGHHLNPAALAALARPLSLDHHSPRRHVLIRSLRPEAYSPCHSRTRSGVSFAAAPSVEPSGAPNSSSSGSNSSSIANHCTRRDPTVALAGAGAAAGAQGPRALEAETQPPTRCNPPGGLATSAPQRPTPSPLSPQCKGHSEFRAVRQENLRGFPRPTHSSLKKEEGVDLLPIPEIPVFRVEREEG